MKFLYTIFFTLLITYTASSQARLPEQTATIQQAAIKFFPNPAITQITFDLQKGVDKSHIFQVFNFIGKKIYEQQASEKIVLPLNDFFRGVYIFQLRDKTGKVIEAGKFQVSK
jgi:Secretion system C-terminal sorting domain